MVNVMGYVPLRPDDEPLWLEHAAPEELQHIQYKHVNSFLQYKHHPYVAYVLINNPCSE